VLATLDRPDLRNAVDLDTLGELIELQQRADLRVLVLTGAPPAFSAGADLRGVGEEVFAAELRRALHGLVALPAPVVAAIDGPALGAGAQLAAFCDLRIATPGSIVGVPAARLGLVVEQATVARLVREFGWAVARGMLTAAETYRADHLHALGAIHRLGDLDAALAWAAELAALAPLSIAGHKVALEAVARGEAESDAATAARLAAWHSTDAVEGRSAFLDKRKPEFRGS
jgi:enoyl-CoA hydratase